MAVDTIELRDRISKRRKALSSDEVNELSGKICANILSFCRNRWPRQVWTDLLLGSYRVAEGNSPGEADPSSLTLSELFGLSTFVYPRIISAADGTMEMVAAFHPTDWVKGPFGLWEPRSELPAVQPRELSLVLCPGVIFDEVGSRVGRGKGFYDRYLFHSPGAFRIGLAYDFQVMREPIPQKMHDQRMDVVITESRILTFSERSPIPIGS